MSYPTYTKQKVIQAFWKKVALGGPDDCWNWTGGSSRGYGKFQVRGTHIYAHRFSMELHSGKKVPRGKLVLHRCDNGLCVNPKHLFLGTHRENSADMVRKGRSYKPKGSLNNNAKLDEDKVRYIRSIRSIRNSRRNRGIVAKRFGVSRWLVCLVAAGRSWKHVK